MGLEFFKLPKNKNIPEIGKSYDIEMRVFRRDVKIIGETEKSIKVCCNYRLKGEEKWKPIYSWIPKESIIDFTEIKK